MIPIYQPFINSETLQYAKDALDSTWVSSSGKYLDLVTEYLEKLLNIKHVLLVNNGTCAAHLVSKALQFKFPNIKNIIVQDNVYVAAWNAFLFDNYYKLSSFPSSIKTWNYDIEYLTNNIIKDAAILFTHNLGNVMDISKFDKYICIEDNCEGFLGRYFGEYSGTKSFASSISFFGNKNITSGEGGAFLTNDDETFEYIKCIKGQGQSNKKFIHSHLGYNYRMTNVAAALLYGQLKQLDKILELKSKVFSYYKELLKHPKILFQEIEDNTIHANWMFGIRILDADYDKLNQYMMDCGIETRPMFYPINEHQYLINNPNVNIVSDCKIASLLNKEIIILPSYPTLSREEQSFICGKIIQYIND